MNKTTLSIKKIIATLAILFIPFLGFSQSTQTWDIPGTYSFTVPTGVVSIDVQAWGGGGAGGGVTGSNAAAGGGAGGGFAKKTAFTVVPGTTYTITVGAGGLGDKNSGNAGAASSLTIGGTTYLLAVGGNGGNLASSDDSSSTGGAAVSTGNSGYTTTQNYYGGAGGNGDYTYWGSGAGGSSAGTGSNGNAGVFSTAGTAVSGGGAGQDGSWWKGNGANGFNPGGGGAGAYDWGDKDRSGGNGGNGQVIISWLCPIFSLNATTTPATLCSTFGANVSVTGTATGLPVGTYTVTYNLTGSNTATGSTATMTVSTAGAGSFTTNAIPLAGATTITITNLSKLTCSNAIVANNTAVVTLTATPSILTTTPNSRIGNGTVALSASTSAGSISWFSAATGGTALATNTNYTTPSLTTTTTYYVQTTNGSCTSSPRVAVTATINNPEIAVSGNGFTINDGDNSPSTSDFTDLGSTFVNVDLTRTYIIQNIGAATLTVGAITIGGANAAEFVVTNPPTTIAPGTNALFTITFKPTVVGTRNATVSFTTDDSDETPFNFNISGTGIPGVKPEINLRATNDIPDGASAGSSPSGVVYGSDFGSTLAGTPIVKTFTIQNTGTGVLNLTGTPKVTITGDAVFTVTAQPSSTIAAGGSTTFQVTFNSAITGNFLAIVSIANDDDNESIYDFVILGKATVAGREIDIQGNDVTIVDGDTTPSALDQTDFGITDTTTKIAIPYHILNYGNAALGLTTTVSITGPNAAFFTASAVLTSSLAVGATTSFVLTFNPTAAVGIKTATITITNTDNVGTPVETSYDFAVSAEIKVPVALTAAPGGVTTNLKYWIKADSNIGSVDDNVDITTWQDNTTGSTKNAIAKLGKEPKFLNNIANNVNFNPVIHFNGANAMAGGQGFNNLDMFIVVKPTNTVNYLTSPMDTYCGDDVASNKANQDVTGFEMGNTSSRYTNEIIAYNQAANTGYGTGEISTTKSYSGVNIFNPSNNGTRMSLFNNANTLTTIEVNTGTYKNIVNSRYWLGASETFGPSYDGDFLEVINYSVSNTATDKRRIESYLAIKYGITLGINGTSVDYYNSTSTNTATAIYTASAGYNYNIAGIGRDDASQLNQKQSKTENTNDDVTMGLTNIYDRNSDNPNAFGGDKNYLVWGNNNGSLLAKPAVVVNMSSGITPALVSDVEFISINRTWRVVETGGDVPSVKVSIPSTLLTATITPPGDFLMFISSSPVFNPTSEYRVMRVNGSKLEADYDFNGVKYITFGYAPEKTFVRAIDFDGSDDYLDAGKVLDLNTSFTISAWVKSNSINKTILSKRNSPFTAGYDLSINNSGKVEMSWMNGTKQSIVSSLVLPTNIWHNIAVTYNGTTAKLYIDGVEDTSVTLSNVPANPTQSFLIAAANGLAPTSFFKGTIDEVRIWTVALTDKQLRYVMNQEMSNNASFASGSIIPNNITSNDISSIPWSNVAAYYPMSTYTFTNAKDISNNNYTAALKNLTTVDRQTAPLPYESASNGDWGTAATWLNNTVQDIPNSIAYADDTRNVDWNIVKTTHNVTTTENKTVLGLLVNSNMLGITNDSKIEVSHYLKLDGKIDLVGMSQLIQTEGSDLAITSSGSIERDQQGQSNKYNYNYWSSPVSPINNTLNNKDYTVAGIMKDGTTATPQNITWLATGVDGSPTSPISLAEYWLWTFESDVDLYDKWKKVTSTTLLKVGQGYTLKGSGATGSQNYTFVGKPNNGTITTNTVVADQLFLTGNPYPSALDSNKFITDNLYLALNDGDGFDGTLYFWEHSSSNNTHTLKDYLGGYAVRNLLTGLPPVVAEGINGVGLSSKIPNQYIPVGQGFFVYGKTSGGGPILFKNSQRAFQKENSIESNTLFKTNPDYKKHKTTTNNDNDPVEKNNFKIIRLGFNSSNKYHRQVVLGFAGDKATSGIDYGYDSYMLDDFANDMYLLNGEDQLAIEGEGHFKNTASYPVGVKAKADGKVKFMLDGLENFDPQQAIYIYDDLTKIYHDISIEGFEVDLAKGENTTRFSIRFIKESTDKTLGVEETTIQENTIKTSYIQNKNILVINNSTTDTQIEKVILYSILGQSIATWEVKNQEQQNIQLPIKSISSGIYIAKIKTSNGDLSKKIIVK